MSDETVKFSMLGKKIDETTADALIDAYHTQVPDIQGAQAPVRSVTFTVQEIVDLGTRLGAEKVRAYFAWNTVGVTLVLVGIDKQGQEIRHEPKHRKLANQHTKYSQPAAYDNLIEYGTQCPPHCDQP